MRAIWSARQNCSHNVSQKVKRIRRLSEKIFDFVREFAVKYFRIVPVRDSTQQNLGCRKWGCNKWGFKGCLAALPRNQQKSAFFALFLPFSPFSGGPEEHLENLENGGKRPFSSNILGFP